MKFEILLAITGVVSLAVALIIGQIAIPLLKKLKFGQMIREEGPKWHEGKSGTPTIGGVIFIIAALVATALGAVNVNDFTSALLPALAAISFGLVGFVDDYIKVVKKRNLGLRKAPKFLLQFVCTIGLIAALDLAGYIRTALYIPFFNVTVEFGIFYYLLAAFSVLAIVNAVNLTDGLDGLATCVSIPCLLTLTAFAIMLGLQGSALFSVALIAGLIGFLFYNFHPAKVFMGDTGSLFIGGAVAALCLLYNMLLLFLFVGIIFTFETLSVVLQVGYFKLTHGKRIFKMTPVHHHFEMCGWSETKIVFVFTAVTVVFSILGFLGFMNFVTV